MVCTQPGQNLSSEQKVAINLQVSQILTVGGGFDIGAKAAKEAKATGRAEEIDIWTFKLCEAVGLNIIEKKASALRAARSRLRRPMPERPRRGGIPRCWTGRVRPAGIGCSTRS